MAGSSSSRIEFLHLHLLRWYEKNARALPWRRTRDPYRILVSEIMLQQTQVSRVEIKFRQFIRQYPSFRSLARASRADVVRAWRGMGYNNRAVRLRELARIVMEEHGGQLPGNPADLAQLPGVGRYTSNAIACFAFGRRVPVVDVNVRRVLSRFVRKRKHAADLESSDAIWRLAADILPRNAEAWNQAVMELGATICVSRKPKCIECPVSAGCSSRTLDRNIARHARRDRHPKKREPAYAGIPRRIWRGRIVESLRTLDGKSHCSMTAVGKTIKPDFTASDLGWLNGILQDLMRDGIIERIGGERSHRIALARG